MGHVATGDAEQFPEASEATALVPIQGVGDVLHQLRFATTGGAGILGCLSEAQSHHVHFLQALYSSPEEYYVTPICGKVNCCLTEHSSERKAASLVIPPK